MTPLWAGLLLAGVGIASAVGLYYVWDSDGPRFLLEVLSFMGAVLCLLTAILIPSIIYGSRAVGHTNCRRFGQQTNRPVKFVLYNSWSTGDCLTPSAGGRWIPISNLRQLESKP